MVESGAPCRMSVPNHTYTTFPSWWVCLTGLINGWCLSLPYAIGGLFCFIAAPAWLWHWLTTMGDWCGIRASVTNDAANRWPLRTGRVGDWIGDRDAKHWVDKADSEVE